MAAAGSKVQCGKIIAALALQEFDGQRVPLGEIGDVDVIANAGAVEGRIVIAKYIKVWPQSGSSFQRQGQQMGLGIVSVTDFAAFVGSGRVEVAERNWPQTIGAAICIEDAFKEQFRFTVRVDGLAAGVFGNRYFLGRAVYRTRGGENKIANTGVHRGVHQRQAILYVVVKILSRI